MIHSYFCRFCSICIALLLFTDFAIAQNQSLEQTQDTDQTNLLSDQQTPFMLFDREILSHSQDIMGCSHGVQRATYSFQNIIERELDSTLNDILGKDEGGGSNPIMKTTSGSLLVAVPLAMLNKPLAIGAAVIDISDNGNEFYQNPDNRQGFLAIHRDRNLGPSEIQIKLTGSYNGQYLLKLVHCPRAIKDSCTSGTSNSLKQYTNGIPILGISQKHQAVIVDINSLGHNLQDTTSFALQTDLVDAMVSPIELSDSHFIFDITSKMQASPHPHPQVTFRWFIKFNLLESEEGFVSRLPIQGVNYLTVKKNRAFPEITSTPPILHWRIFKDHQINPVHFYIKNVPYEYQDAVVQSFEYWNSIFVSQIARVNPALSQIAQENPPLSYTFIQGNYDNQQEIITGDIRFNVLEWDTQYKRRYRGVSVLRSNKHTGEIWSSYTFIQGPQLVDLHQKWFQYSQAIRRNGFVQDMSFSPINYVTNDRVLDFISQVYGQPRRIQVIKLAPADETVDSYLSRELKLLFTHELGHALGLDHNFKGNIGVENGYINNSVMDYTTQLYDLRKPILGVYDQIAIAYGYLGLLPHEDQTDMACPVSEEVALFNPEIIEHFIDQGYSVLEIFAAARIGKDQDPECSSLDSGAFPLERFFGDIQQVIDSLTKQNIDSFPHLIWNGSVNDYIGYRIFSILNYHLLADTSYDRMQSVLIEGRKAQNPQEVKDMIVNNYIQPLFCHAKLNAILEENAHHINQGTINSLSYEDRILQNNAIRLRGLLDTYLQGFNITIDTCSI